jgi:hypothetical protein
VSLHSPGLEAPSPSTSGYLGPGVADAGRRSSLSQLPIDHRRKMARWHGGRHSSDVMSPVRRRRWVAVESARLTSQQAQ